MFPFCKKNILPGIACIPAWSLLLCHDVKHMFQCTFSFIMEYPKTCKAISITIVILRILALSYLIYVLSIATTPTNHPYETNVTLLSWPTFRYEDAFRIDVLLFNISIGQAAVLLVVDFLLLYGSFRQIPQFLNAWGSSPLISNLKSV